MTEKISFLWEYFKKVRFFLLVGGLILAESLFVLISVGRQWQSVSKLQSRKEEIRKEIAKLSSALDVINSLDRSKISSQLAMVKAALPSQKKTSGLVRGVAAIASASGVAIRSLEFSPGKIATDSATTMDEVVAGSQARSFKVDVVIETDLEKLLVFLTKLQLANQLMGVKSVNYTVSAIRQPEASLALDVYFQPLPQPAVVWDQVRSVTAAEEKILGAFNSPDVFIIPEEQR